jgi:hypothetical protein
MAKNSEGDIVNNSPDRRDSVTIKALIVSDHLGQRTPEAPYRPLFVFTPTGDETRVSKPGDPYKLGSIGFEMQLGDGSDVPIEGHLRRYSSPSQTFRQRSFVKDPWTWSTRFAVN